LIGIWAIVKPLLDDTIFSKISFVDSIDEYIDKERQPARYGGTLKSKYTFVPAEENPKQDDPMRHQLEHEFDNLIKQYLDTTHEELSAATPPQRIEASSRRNELAEQMIAKWEALEPYRARTIFHRLNLVEANGTIDWDKHM
jgi:hypothetical protein